MSIFFFTSSGDTPTANEHSPSPSCRPADGRPRWWSLPHIGGCGFCNGFGCTRRRGIDQCLTRERVFVVGPALHHVLDRLLPHRARLVRVDPETFELEARR